MVEDLRWHAAFLHCMEAEMLNNLIIEDVLAGKVICQIGQVDQATQKQLDKMVRAGGIQKWRGYWHPVPGAQFGIGPLKTCWGRRK